MLTSLVSLLLWRAETLKYETRLIDDLLGMFHKCVSHLYASLFMLHGVHDLDRCGF
jgi:hypothetical protein